MTTSGSVIVLMPDIRRIPYLAKLIEADIDKRLPSGDRRLLAVAGWGFRPTAQRAMRLAQRHGVPYWALEDGFLRSIGLPGTHPTLSLVVDDLGIYYAADRASRLESLIQRPHTSAEQQRAADLIQEWRALRLTKYNHLREFQPHGADAELNQRLPERFVLVIDQTRGDASIQYGLADSTSFKRMLAAALAEYPDLPVVVKIHPEVMQGRKQGYFDLAELSHQARIIILAQEIQPAALLERTEAVYVVTSQFGFEGLLWNKPVRTFGMPFYAGWGLTQDDLTAPDRRCSVALTDLVYAALVDYPRYIDPDTGERCSVERAMAFLAFQKQQRERFPAQVYASHFFSWKQPWLQSFMQGSRVEFIQSISECPAAAPLVVWGRADTDLNLAADTQVFHVEDGFLRSVGLGAEWVKPLSWVFDRRGLYYDARQPSDLEHLLQTYSFDEALLQRAAALRAQLCASGVTKYNVTGSALWQRPAQAQRVILVVGQVESDASIRWGSPHLRRNIDLLRVVRQSHPDAYVLYKPHPDVQAGVRQRGVDEHSAQQTCDAVIDNQPLDTLLAQVDEVHVLTSLAGFEALLRGKRVVTYGQPFYAGWGLTEDHAPLARRTRCLSLDALVAATLILYPTYISRRTGQFTTPETALAELIAWRQEPSRWWYPLRRWLARWACRN